MSEIEPKNSDCNDSDKPARASEQRDDGPVRFSVSEDLFCSCRDDLYEIAKRCINSQWKPGLLQPTELLHEAFLALVARNPDKSFSEHEFRCYVATVMRNILCTAARRQMTLKRGLDWERVGVDPDQLGQGSKDASMALILDEAMRALEESDPRSARVAELKVFGSLTTNQIALWLEISERTVQLDWKYARAWLTRALSMESS